MRRCIAVHAWRPQTVEQIDADHLWQEYVALGRWKNFAFRALPQLTIAWLSALLMMKLLGFPRRPAGAKPASESIIPLSFSRNGPGGSDLLRGRHDAAMPEMGRLYRDEKNPVA